MRSLPLMLSCALALTTLVACDKKDEAKKDGDKKEDKAEKDDGKADAKKAGEGDKEESAANAVDDEEGCIHDKKEAHVEGEEGSCDHHGAQPTESTGHFGAEFALADAKPLSAVLASGVPSEAVKVSGTVGKVCQKKGCWMVIKDGVASARVMMKGHGFAVPMDSRGKKALVEGTLSSRTFTEAQVKHLEKDAGKDPGAVGGERTEHVLTATGVEIKS